MKFELSSNAKAILLLTAPLIAGRGRGKGESFVKPLSISEYHRLACRLRELQCQPADLLAHGAGEIVSKCRGDLDSERLEWLLGRGFLLALAVDHWQKRAIWVVSRADDAYPSILKKRLGKDSPVLLYGCGDMEIAAARGALAIVGSRNVKDSLIEYARDVAALTAEAGRTVVSGAAQGIDRAAMNGALEAGGKAVGVLAGNLERTTMHREHRNLLLEGRLVLLSSCDPRARFNVGHAMQRNKAIYALADAALVVDATANKGGTWAGAIEQLQKYRAVPVYVRSTGERSEGIEVLQREGAKPWPNPDTPEALKKILDAASSEELVDPEQRMLTMEAQKESSTTKENRQAESRTPKACERIDGPKTEATVAKKLKVSKKQAKDWLVRVAEEEIRELFKDVDVCKTREEISKEIRASISIQSCLNGLVKEKFLDKIPGRPVKYRSGESNRSLFDP